MAKKPNIGRKAPGTAHPPYQNIVGLKGYIKVIQSQEIITALAALIESTEKRFYLSVYQAVYIENHKNNMVNGIWKLLKAAAENKKDIRVMINQNFHSRVAREINAAVANQLRKHRIPAKFHAKNTRAHAKYFVSDGARVIVGSHNMSERALRENYEMSVYINEPEVGKAFEESFLEHWERGVKIN